MSRWWRAYDEALHDPKLQRLPPAMFKAWFNLMCLASKNGGVLPAIGDVAYELRTSEQGAAATIAGLVNKKLLDRREDGAYEPHNWSGRQFQSDTSNERVKRHRNAKRNVTQAVTVTPPETEQIQNRTDIAPDGAATSKVYAFEDGVIRLSEKDFNKWGESFPRLDLRAELMALSHWAEEQGPNWFHAVKGALAKKNREAKERREKPANGTGNPLFEGIT